MNTKALSYMNCVIISLIKRYNLSELEAGKAVKGSYFMSTLTTKTIEIMNMLPVEDQELLYNIAKKLVRAWDPDFTKLTPSEEKELKNSIEEISNGDFVSENDINWN